VKFAAIDVGTNAVRLLLARVIEEGEGPYFKKEALVRMPIRLGDDAFTLGRISEGKVEQLVESMRGFKHLMAAYPARAALAYATSAMREAENGEDVRGRVAETTGIEIEIIDGPREAEVIYANHIERRLIPSRNYLYVDVGGGSTELSMIADRAVVASGSFKVGTVRMLRDRVENGAWDKLKAWVKDVRGTYKSIDAIGSGGNINKLFKLARGKEGRPIAYGVLKDLSRWLAKYSYEERIVTLGLRPDRADVIVPASDIYLAIMKWARIKRMHVPQFGLSDGMVHLLYDNYRNRRS
jgi:exopolyphosphatase/guanosine-5'-triphosphate,3'-diphosphate pyrophosphatase